MMRNGLIAVLRGNGAPLAICEVTVQGWQHRETVTGTEFAERYFTERERDMLAVLKAIMSEPARNITMPLALARQIRDVIANIGVQS